MNNELESILIAIAYKCADCMGYEKLTKHCQDDIKRCEIDCSLKPHRQAAIAAATFKPSN